jgi:dsRNA-specific ribonuclease
MFIWRFSLLLFSSDSSSNGHFGVDSKDNDARNPIGELQEMTQKKMWPPPVYDFTDEIGPAHAREFVCVVKLFNVTEQGIYFICC